MHKSSLFFVVVSCAFVACSHDEPKSVAQQQGQRRERISIEAPTTRETAEEDMRNSRAMVMRVLAQDCDAITAPFPGEMSIDLPEGGSDLFASSIALVGFPKGKTPPQVRIAFEIDLAGPQRTAKSSVSLGLQEALGGWSPILEQRGSAAAVKLVMRGKWIGDEIPKDLPPLRMCLALGDVSTLGKATPDRPNVLVLSVDTLRADHLSCYGYARKTSPNIDALVGRGVLFERAYSSAPWTLPSYGSLFTGLLPADHRAGIVTQREDAFGTDETPTLLTTEHLCTDVPTLAELMSKRGYQTGAFVCNPFLAAGAGLARGFQQYTSYQYTAQNGVDLALEWIEGCKGGRWFAFVHMIDPHWPYAPPPPYDTQFAKHAIGELKDWPPELNALRAHVPDDEMKAELVDEYDGEIAFTDAQVGRMLDALEKQGMLENTLIVFHSDHGEEFWEHGSCDHGHSQYDELLRVPFALVLPGKIEAGKRVATRVRTLDLLPTIGAYVGFDAPAGIEGKSLLPVIAGTETKDRDDVAEAILHGPREIKAVLVGKDKLIASGAGTNRVFDLGGDAGEKKDRSGDAAEVVKRLRGMLDAHHAAAKKSACKAAPLELDEAARRRLQGYGYAGSGKSEPIKKP